MVEIKNHLLKNLIKALSKVSYHNFFSYFYLNSMTTHFRVFGGRKIADIDKNPMNQETKLFFS
jgi:hypothetical protein